MACKVRTKRPECKLTVLVKEGQGRAIWACEVCGQETPFTETPPGKLHMKCSPEGRRIKAGGEPGTRLKSLIAQLGITPRDLMGAGCAGNCEKMARWMDSIGVEGCKKHRERIIKQLDEYYAKLTLTQKLYASAAAVKLAAKGFIINPMNPSSSLFDEAIRLATESIKSAPPSRS